MRIFLIEYKEKGGDGKIKTTDYTYETGNPTEAEVMQDFIEAEGDNSELVSCVRLEGENGMGVDENRPLPTLNGTAYAIPDFMIDQGFDVKGRQLELA